MVKVPDALNARSASNCTTSIRLAMLRPIRSRRTVTSVSPWRRWSRHLCHCGRLALTPLTPWSVKMRLQPCSRSRAVCASGCWSSRETRSYPITAMTEYVSGGAVVLAGLGETSRARRRRSASNPVSVSRQTFVRWDSAHLIDNGEGQVSDNPVNHGGTPMSGEVTVSWPTCDQEDCNGVRIDSGQCLAHAEDHDLDGALAQISQTGNIDARGVTISSALLGQILDAVPRNSEGRQQFADARFDRATFQGDAVFLGAIFQGDAVFLGAIFQGDAVFVEATFQSVAGFRSEEH